MAKKVAELVVEVLADAGVRRIYGFRAIPSTASRIRSARGKSLEWVHVRHEEAAAFAAGAEAHLTGRWRCAPEAAGRAICT